ncbi:serine/threonine-protein kinase [Paludisphaera sp.]|uniref:serine/threonine-protein kinase n=1 Tax=Paludisphaera sp. TaxID=2017432 RepID=UPI00301D7210
MIAVNQSPRRGPRPACPDALGTALSIATHPLDPPTWHGPPGISEVPTSIPEPHARAGGSQLRPFQRIGPYRLIVRLGRGAQGEVWKAVGEMGPGFVALKILTPGLSINPRRLAQFRREAERGARLVGPSLLRVADAGEADGCFYMAMPYVEAVTLQDVVRERRLHRMGDDPDPVHPLVEMEDPAYYLETTRIMAGVARALHRVHVHRVAHRDVKPGNILLERRAPFGAFLCDLGLGRDLDHATVDQMRDGAGTLLYMAPERLLKAPADEVLADVYSMGATAFEALTLGRRLETIRGVPTPALPPMLARARPRAPREVDPNLPASLEVVLLRALERAPGDRHRSAGELADDLEAAIPRARRELGLGDPPRPHVLDRRRHRAARREVR